MRFGREDYNRRIVDIDNKIPEDEPCFFLRGKDKFAPALLLEWAKQLRLFGGDPNMAYNAEEHAQRMIDWQQKNGSFTPDMYDSIECKKWKDELKGILQNKELNFNRVSTLIERIYGSSNRLYLFIQEEVKGTVQGLNDITIDCLRIDNEDRYSQCKLAIFISKWGWKIIKNEL